MAVNDIPTVVLDYTKPPEQLVVDIINNDNGTSLTPDMVTFGTPVLLDGSGKYNSQVVATATDKSIYRGSTTISYNRIDIGDIPAGRPTIFPVFQEVNISDLIPKIDEAFNLALTPADYIDALLPTFLDNIPNEEKPFDLFAAPTSLIFLNKLTLRVHRPAINLLLAIPNVILSGLTYTPPPQHH